MSEAIKRHRKTKETDIHVLLDMAKKGSVAPDTTLPFFDHMLNAMAFHGEFALEVTARGDTEVDPHHLVEDVGLVLGSALHEYRENSGGIVRYGQASIPMDDALGEAVVDAGGRPYLVWDVDWPQSYAGDFDLSLCKEFFWGLATKGRINLHLSIRYAQNGHHAAEALFKAAGRALAAAYRPRAGGEEGMSTKGVV